MGDMLIRGIDDELKKSLEEQARRNRRSLSEEAISQMRNGLANAQVHGQRPGDLLRRLVQGAYFSEEELAAIEALRKETDRDPPDFR